MLRYMFNCNIVLLGAGRRYSFVERLQNHGFNVISIEKEPFAPISKICQVFRPEGFSEYINTINIDKHNTLILPLIDAETVNKDNYRNCLWVGSDHDAAHKCYNKQSFDAFMIDFFPEYYPIVIPGEPIVIKPIFGFASKGISYSIHSNIHIPSDSFKQRRIQGKEYSVDAYFTREGKYYCCIARTRDRVSGGEVIDSEISKETTIKLAPIVQAVGEKIGLRGPICMQFMIEESTGNPYLFEINARFGGGCILSLEAGLDMISLIRAEYGYGAILKPSECIIRNLKMRRVNREIFFND